MRVPLLSSGIRNLLRSGIAAGALFLVGCRSNSGLEGAELVDPSASATFTLPAPVEAATMPAVEAPSTPAQPAAPSATRFPKMEIAKKVALNAPAPEPVVESPSTTNFDPSPASQDPRTLPAPTQNPGTEAGAPSDPPRPGNLQNMISDVYRLKPLDQVITTMRFPNQQVTEEVVDEKGMITLPLLGDVKVAGFTTSELEAELARLYVEGGFYKRVIVTVLVPTLNYTISGEIYRPGRYEIRGTVTLVQAIAEGGNFTEWADKKKVQIIRGTQFIEKNYFEILSDPRQDIEILPRDSIRVPRKSW